jgi:hypothetical protein
MAMIPHLGSVSPKIEKIVDNTGLDAGVRLDKSAMSAPRGKRKSKVVDTILLTLKEGPTHSAELRSALASRGMSESSLSTGLSILQKNGTIKRDDDGAYYLSVREAA